MIRRYEKIPDLGHCIEHRGKSLQGIFLNQISELNSQNYGSFIITKNRADFIFGKNTEHKGCLTPWNMFCIGKLGGLEMREQRDDI